MSDKRIKLFIITACLLISGSLIWKNFESEKSNTVVYTTKKQLLTTENKKDSESTTKIKVTKPTLTVEITEANTEKITEITSEQPLYINLNTADMESLCRLDGIGEGLAEAIIRYREENSRFNNIEEIMNVHGIGEGIFNAVRDYIYVENPVYPEPEEEIDDIPEFVEEIEEPVEEIPEEIPTEPPLTLEDVAPIDLNTADIELLMLLPNVDEEIAGKIIELRQKIHGFSNPLELLYVEELSEDMVREIIDYVVVEVEFQE